MIYPLFDFLLEIENKQCFFPDMEDGIIDIQYLLIALLAC
jgi:hypothetical protein